MNILAKTILVTLAAGVAVSADAAIVNNSFNSNAVNYCQAFTPGPSNTIRNRVVGSENIGAPMNVACNFHSVFSATAGAEVPTALEVFFANNNTAGGITVTCTMLTGYQGDSSMYLSTKTTPIIAPGGVAQEAASWGPADNPTPGATNLGNYLIGINCNLPTGAVINDTYLSWSQENGVGV